MTRVSLPVLLAGLLLACQEAPEPSPAQETAGPVQAVDEGRVCGSWVDDLAPSCVATATGCLAQCQDDANRLALSIMCQGRHCELMGEGHGGGRSCTISADDREGGCGLCRTAHRECHGGR